jgi:hypothetical protein
LVRYGYIRLKFAENWEDEYKVTEKPKQTESTEAAEAEA